MTSPVKLAQMVTAQTVAAKYPPKVLKEVAGQLKPEPTFGLAVTGIVNPKNLKPNSKTQVGDVLFITKPLGIGLMTTAEKQDKLLPKDIGIATEVMCLINSIGAEIAKHPGVNAMTDATGFGLLGHLIEICEGSNVSAKLLLNHALMLKKY